MRKQSLQQRSALPLTGYRKRSTVGYSAAMCAHYLRRHGWCKSPQNPGSTSRANRGSCVAGESCVQHEHMACPATSETPFVHTIEKDFLQASANILHVDGRSSLGTQDKCRDAWTVFARCKTFLSSALAQGACWEWNDPAIALVEGCCRPKDCQQGRYRDSGLRVAPHPGRASGTQGVPTRQVPRLWVAGRGGHKYSHPYQWSGRGQLIISQPSISVEWPGSADHFSDGNFKRQLFFPTCCFGLLVFQVCCYSFCACRGRRRTQWNFKELWPCAVCNVGCLYVWLIPTYQHVQYGGVEVHVS